MWEQTSRKHFRRTVSVGLFFVVLSFAGSAFAQVDQYTVGVDGMACPFCAYGIEKKLKALDGVASLDIHIEKGTVDVHLDQGGKVTPDDLERAIEKAGFEIRDLHVRGEASIENQNGSAVAQFSDGLGLPITGKVSKSGEQTLEGEIVQKQGTWNLVVSRTGGDQ